MPWARGPLSAAVINTMEGGTGSSRATLRIDVVDALIDDDFQLALYLCYQDHLRDSRGADRQSGSSGSRLDGFRSLLESSFEHRLRDEVGRRKGYGGWDTTEALEDVIASSTTTWLSQHFEHGGSLDQFRELCIHQSVSPWCGEESHDVSHQRRTPQVRGALFPAESGEVGASNARRVPDAAFSNTLSALGLHPSRGSYVEVLPGTTLAAANLRTMFRLHPKWEAASVGHSSLCVAMNETVMASLSRAAASWGTEEEGRRFFEDAASFARDGRANVARRRQAVLAQNPATRSDVLFGAMSS
jgi:hypothetical protein